MRPAERAVLVSIVVIVAAALRVGFVTTAHVQAPLRVDAGQYAQYAVNLVEHGTYSLSEQTPPPPDSFRSPGYPLLLALCRLVGGEGGWYALARWLQIVLSTATVLFTYKLARVFLPFSAALVAAALAALSPHLVVAPAFILTECLSSFVVTLGLWLLARSERRRATVAAALVLGCAALCNETLVVLPVVCAFAIWLRDRRRALLALAIALVPFAGWQLRNKTTELHLSGSARATASISHGSYPGMVFEDPRYFGFPYREDPAQPEFGASWSKLFDVLGERVAERPWRYVSWYALEKPVWLWSWPLVQGSDVYVYPVGNSPYERQPVMAATHAVMRWLHVPVMLLAAAGALLAIVRGRRNAHWAAHAAGLVALFGTLAYLPVIPDPRYLQPFRPVLFTLCAASVPLLLAWLRRDRSAEAERSEPAAASAS